MKIQEAIWSQYAEVGNAALKSGLMEVAETMYMAAAEEAQRSNADPVLLAASWFGLAQTHHTLKRGVLATHYYKKAMQVYEQNAQKFGPQLAATWDNLAELFLIEGELLKAHNFYRKSVVLYEKMFGKESPILAPRLMRLGYICSQFKEFDKALAYYERAKALTKKKVDAASSNSGERAVGLVSNTVS